jgi:hypothetical protein
MEKRPWSLSYGVVPWVEDMNPKKRINRIVE